MKKILSLLFLLNMMLQLTAQNVGIGTTTPTEKLQVTDGNIGLFNTTDVKNWRLSYVQSQDRFSIQEDAVSRLSIANGGSVGIGTTIPNTTAILDIGSTTKGVLFPRMTTTQRASITSPPAGLMVYDTDRKTFFHHDGAIWRIILNSDYWSKLSTLPNYVSNTTDSVAIGTLIPEERLDVNGNIRSRNNLIANNNVTAQGTVSGAALTTGGNIVVAGTSILSGDVTTNSDLIINNTAATMQLKSSDVNKGFFQLSGNNVRFGTNSGNTTGNLIMRMNGNDRVQINAAGDIDLDGKITRSAVTGTNNLLPLCFGYINDDGTIRNGSGNFTVVKDATGKYKITGAGISEYSIVVASTDYFKNIVTATGVYSPTNSYIRVTTYSLTIDDYSSASFNFIVY